MFSFKNNLFVSNLIYSIDNTIVTAPTGKYGKAEIDTWETAKEKLEKLLLAEPQNVEDLTAYVLFVDSISGFRNKKVFNKVNSILEQAKLMNVSGELTVAYKVFSKVKNRRILMLILRILIFLILLAGIVVLNIISLWFLIISPALLCIPFTALDDVLPLPDDTNPFR